MYRILSALMFVLILTGCDPSSEDKMTYFDQTKSIDLSQENLNNVALGSTKKDIERTYGKPKEIEKIDSPAAEYYVYSGFEFGIIDDLVSRIYINSEDHQTAKGVKIGDRKSDIIDVYGGDHYERNETGTKVLGYFDKQHNANIEFILNEDRIKGIILSTKE